MSNFKPTPKAELIQRCDEIIEDQHYKKNRTKSPSLKRASETTLKFFLSIKHYLES